METVVEGEGVWTIIDILDVFLEVLPLLHLNEKF
jgi:hypothetical protein